MSNFNCNKCNSKCIDTGIGYISGCEHYPADDFAVKHFVDIYMKAHVSELAKKDKQFNQDWLVGQWLYNKNKRVSDA